MKKSFWWFGDVCWVLRATILGTILEQYWNLSCNWPFQDRWFPSFMHTWWETTRGALSAGVLLSNCYFWVVVSTIFCSSLCGENFPFDFSYTIFFRWVGSAAKQILEKHPAWRLLKLFTVPFFSRRESGSWKSLKKETWPKEIIYLGGGFKHFLFSPLLGEMIQF